MVVGPFNDSLIRNPTETFSEVHERVVAHIETEDAVLRKNVNSHFRQPKPKESIRDRPLQVYETSTKKRTNSRYVPYVAMKDESRGKASEEPQTRPKFRVSYKELLGMARVVDKLKFLEKMKQNLRSRKDSWCKFHSAFMHNVERCIALGHQLADLVKDGFLKKYLEDSQERPQGEAILRESVHETPIHGESNTMEDFLEEEAWLPNVRGMSGQ